MEVAENEVDKVLTVVAQKFYDKFTDIATKFGCICRVAHGLSSDVRDVNKDTKEILIVPGTEIDKSITVTNLYSFSKLSRVQRRIAQGKRN